MKIRNLKEKSHQYQPDDNDCEVWQDVVSGVQKIEQPNVDLSKPKMKGFVIRNNINVFDVYGGETLGYIKAGDCNGIDNSTLKRFKRGEYPIEAILDLHGYTTDEAYNKVENFLKNCYQRKKRCVQIVTGKGLHLDDDIFAVRGVLKDLVPKWLNADNLRPLILMFDYSRPEDGGVGALTILLRRKR